MRISDWSSDVCSSDLAGGGRISDRRGCNRRRRPAPLARAEAGLLGIGRGGMESDVLAPRQPRGARREIGRASFRDRWWQYVYLSVVAVSLTKKQMSI